MCKTHSYGKANKAGQTESSVQFRFLKPEEREANHAKCRLRCSRTFGVLCRSKKNRNHVDFLKVVCNQTGCPSCGAKKRLKKCRQAELNFRSSPSGQIWRYEVTARSIKHWSNDMASKCLASGAKARWVSSDLQARRYVWYTDAPVVGLTGDVMPVESAILDHEYHVWNVKYETGSSSVDGSKPKAPRWSGCCTAWKEPKKDKSNHYELLAYLGNRVTPEIFQTAIIKLRMRLPEIHLTDAVKMGCPGSSFVLGLRTSLDLGSHDDPVGEFMKELPCSFGKTKHLQRIPESSVREKTLV